MSLIRPLFLAVALHAAAASAGDTIAVLEFRSRAHPIAAADVSDRVREAAGRAAPDARIIDRIGDADYVIAGKVSRGGLGYRASLELRDRRGEVLQRASATAGSRRELLEAVEGATSDLLRSRADGLSADASTIRALPLPVVPAAAEPPSDDVLNLDADASVVVAWDRARRIEARGREEPDEAAAAWRQLAAMRGANPFKETAETRAAQWQAFADGKRAAQAQLARDAERLRKLLPLASVTDAAKIELLVRFATAYGFDKMSPFVALLPSVELRQIAELSLDCAVKEAHACVQLARDADAAGDVTLALDYLGRACEAGAAEACDEAGARWLQGDARDPAKAIVALQRGCD